MTLQNLLNNIGSKETLCANIVGIENKDGAKGAYQKVVLCDDSCETEVAIFSGKGRLLPFEMKGARGQFALTSKDYQGTASVAGFWNDKANVNQQNPSYNAPAPAAAIPNQQEQGGLPLKETSIIRVAIAKSILEAYPNVTDIDRQGLASVWSEWCLTGEWPSPIVKKDAAKDDIPF